jgi:LemA protein
VGAAGHRGLAVGGELTPSAPEVEARELFRAYRGGMDVGIIVAVVVVVVLLALLGFYLWSTYQSLVALKGRVDEGWADLQTQIRQRAALVPNIVDTVGKYATHERGVFQAIERARTETVEAKEPAIASQAESHMQQAIRGVFSTAESFPQLQVSPAFLDLQSSLVDSEDKIQASRRFYNGGVREFNRRIETFPNNLFAKRLGFTRRDFFEAGESAAIAQPPRVQF